MEFGNLKFELRPATDEDFDFAWLLYRDLMKPLTEELLEWNELRQNAVVEEAFTYKGTSIIVVNESNAGWLQVSDIPSGDLSRSALYPTRHAKPRHRNSHCTTAV